MSTKPKTQQPQPKAAKPKQPKAKKGKQKKNQPYSSSLAPNMQVESLGAPVSMGNVVTGKKLPVQSTLIKWRSEYVSVVTGSTAAFALQASFYINPGIAATFPWLSTMAQLYDMYRFRRLRFVYLNKTSSANTGEVNMVYDPDPSDNPPINDAQALQYESRISASAWLNACLEIPKADLNRLPKFFVRNAVVPGEQNTYDTGVLHLIVGGNAAAVKIGQLFVEYEIEFFAPQVVGTGPSPPKSNSQFAVTGTTAVPSGVNTVLPFSTVIFNPLGITSTASGITGLSGSYTFYVQQTLNVTGAFTSAQLNLAQNGVVAIAAVYPTPTAQFTTANIFITLSLIPSDIVTIAVLAVATGVSASSGAGNANSVLIITPA